MAAKWFLAIGPVVAALFVAFAIASCSIFRATFPGAPREEVIASMHRLRDDVDHMERLAAKEHSEERRQQILTLLANMADETRRLHSWPDNHPRIVSDLEVLQEQIRRARIALAKEPPEYRFLRNVSGACITCHPPRH